MTAVPPLTIDVATIARLHLRPGDVLVIRHPGVMSQAQRAYIYDALRVRFPDHQCLVLDHGMELQVVGELPPMPYIVDEAP